MNPEKKLHIISFDIPFPPDYGGVIDVFYKLKGLSESGIKIYLHCFQYGRESASELEKYCQKIYYYKRNTGIAYVLNKKPYIVAGRNHPDLLKNILKIKAPILFEGLHSCYFIDHPELNDYRKIIRSHNIEHDYYHELWKTERNIKKRIYYKKEAKKLKQYESIIQFANSVLTISPSDQKYFYKIHPKSVYIQAFHKFETIETLSGKGEYFLFHGNLSVNENINSINYLVSKIFNDLGFKLVIAGKDPSKKLITKISKIKNIRLIVNPTQEKMEDLIKNAQGCVIPSFQATGLKLKLLTSLYKGRFCFVNSPMVINTGLEKLCIVSDAEIDFKESLKNFKDVAFTEKMISERAQILNKLYSNNKGITKLISQIFTEE